MLIAIRGIVLTALAFGLMIFVHELGHFLAAKLIGVRVDRFSFGFGPKLFGRKWGGTEYMVCPIPLGGYVKLAGGDEGEEATGAADEFVSKTPGQRSLVLVAGPFFSVLFGIPLAMAMFTAGRDVPLAKVSEVVAGSPAWNAGVQYGDRITSLAGRRIVTFDDLRQVAAEMPANKPLSMTVERGAQMLELTLSRAKGEAIGVAFQPDTARVVEVTPGSPAARAGVMPGDQILSVNKCVVGNAADFAGRAADAPASEPLMLLIERGGRTVTLPVERPRGKPLGVGCQFASTRIGEVVEKSPAAGVGLRRGDRILTVNEERLRTWQDFRAIVLASANRPVRLGIERDGRPVAIVVTPKSIEDREYQEPGFTVRLPNEVGFVRPGFPAEGKLEVGDRILAVSGRPVSGWRGIEDAVAGGAGKVALSIERAGQPNEVELTRNPCVRLEDSLGIAPRPVYIVASVHRDSEPPLKAGDEIIGVLKRGIIKVQRRDVSEVVLEEALHTPLQDVLDYMARAGELTVRRGTTELQVKIQPAKYSAGQAGLGPLAAMAVHKRTAIGSVVPALAETWRMSSFAFVILWKLASGDVSFTDLMGPLGIVQQTYLSVKRGWSYFFWLVHLITVNIGVFNLIPIPPLDGGRLVMLGYEKVRGKQPSRRLQEAVLLTGVAIVIMIFIVATFNDVKRMFF